MKRSATPSVVDKTSHAYPFCVRLFFLGLPDLTIEDILTLVGGAGEQLMELADVPAVARLL
ncbi:hypothetical protein [Brucella pituitosa]|uniref:hypothetical protein n=1 Tax=Brucella pituitosa TaxID=571256 RepID=UPI003F4AF20A